MRAKIWMTVYWSWMTLLTATFYARPSWHVPVWSAIGATSAAAVIVGVIRHRPRRAVPWVLLSISLASFAAGDTTYNLLTSIGHEVNPFPSYADLFYLITCVTQVAGMYGLVRASTASRDRSALVDSLVLTSGVGVIYWIFLISPKVRDPDLNALEKIISIAYPMTDVLLLALVARLVVAFSRTPAVLLLAFGVAGLLQSDVAYGLGQLSSSWHIGGPVDIGWIILYCCFGAAALHPSMVTLTEPRTSRPIQMGRTRLVLLAVSALVAPVSLIIEATRGHVRDVTVIATLSALVFLLVMIRLAEVLAANRLALQRERALRQAGDAMVSATRTDDVRHTLSAAITRMTPGVTTVVDLVDGLPEPPRPQPAGHRTTDAELRYTATIRRWLPADVHGFELVLICRLPNRGPVQVPGMPCALVLGADEATLSAMKAPAEVLTAQATLALERIALTDEINHRKSEEYFRTLVQNTADVILIIDDDDTVSYASPSAVSVFGDRSVVGEPLDSLLHVDEQSPAGGLIGLMRPKALSAAPDDAGVDWVVQRHDGQTVHVEASMQDLTDDVTVKGVVITLRDVTDRRRLEQELAHHAFHDPLTGVANRLLFQERAKAAVARAHRLGTTAGVLFIDLDDFKIVNDTMGHQAGDQLLVLVAKRLGEVMRPQDTAARLGGDEFAALIEDVSDPTQIEEIAAQIIVVLAEPFTIGDAVVSGASSVGVATTVEALDVADVLRQADLALYVAKGDGKGQWRRYQPEMHTTVLKRMQVRTELDQAVKESSFELHYQPIIALRDSRAAGFEALVRWQHPRDGLIPPSDFIDIAEESGLIVPLGDWVMRTAIAAAVTWSDQDLYVSVNVSIRQFRTPGFLDTVRAHLAEAGLPPSRLMLEITESLLLPDEDQVREDLEELRAMGVRVAIDDFGTGYSALSYLRRVPIDVVKIDRSFVETITFSEQQRALVEGIVWLAATLGLQVIAEGIETEAERDLLIELGCPLGQGYLFSPPMSHQASVDWRTSARMAA